MGRALALVLVALAVTTALPAPRALLTTAEVADLAPDSEQQEGAGLFHHHKKPAPSGRLSALQQSYGDPLLRLKQQLNHDARESNEIAKAAAVLKKEASAIGKTDSKAPVWDTMSKQLKDMKGPLEVQKSEEALIVMNTKRVAAKTDTLKKLVKMVKHDHSDAQEVLRQMEAMDDSAQSVVQDVHNTELGESEDSDPIAQLLARQKSLESDMDKAASQFVPDLLGSTNATNTTDAPPLNPNATNANKVPVHPSPAIASPAPASPAKATVPTPVKASKAKVADMAPVQKGLVDSFENLGEMAIKLSSEDSAELTNVPSK